MQGPTYIFALQDSSNRFWQVNADGSVSLSNDPYLLEFSPAGWDDIAIQNVRNRQFWGIDRSVTIPLTYIKDGAKIIKHVVYSRGIEDKLFLTICVLAVEYNPGVDYGYWYKQIYKGEVNTTDFAHNDAKVTCTTVEDGLPKHMKANQNTVYELPMNVPEAVQVKMDGINLRNKVNYGTIGIDDAGGGAVGFENYGTMPIILGNQEGDGYGVTYLSVNIEGIGRLPSDYNNFIANSDNWVFKNESLVNVDFTLTGRKKFSCTAESTGGIGGSDSLDIFFVKTGGTKYNIVTGLVLATGQVYDYTYTFNITLQPGEVLYAIRWFYRTTDTEQNGTGVILWSEDSFDTITVTTRRPSTFVPHLPGQYIMQQLINRMTAGEYSAAVSSYLATHTNKVFTCGNAIRGLADPVLKIKITDFFKWWDSYDSVELKVIGSTVDIDRKQNLIDTANIIDLPAPAYGSLKVTVAKEYLFNEVEVGYPEIKSDVGALNGNQEFNCKFNFSLGTVKNPAKIDKVSPVKASCYEQEKIRTTVLDKTTTDYKSDNDVFVNVIDLTQVPAAGDDPAHYLLDRSLNASVTSGLLEPETVWNLAISPARMLQNNLQFIRSCTYRMDGRALAFQTADKNKTLVCAGVTESADIPVGDMGAQFFMPWTLDGDFPAPDDLLQLLDENPLQVFRFPVDGQNFIGIMTKVSIAHSSRKVQDYQFLSGPENDFTKLINYTG